MIKKTYNKISTNKKSFFLFLIVLTLLSSINIFHPGIIFNHDTNFHLHRIIALADNIKIHKHIPVYFNYLNGFGYGNGLFYPDIFLYIPAFLKYIGINIEICYKFLIILINFFSILNIYLCVSKITQQKKYGLLGMILYSCSLYRLIDFVERGSLGEIISFVFIPLVILGIYEILYNDYKKGFYLTIGLSGLCLSHIISLYLTIWFIILLILINIKCLKNKKRLIHLFINILFPMLITIFFWLPMLEQLLSTKLDILNNSQIIQNIVPLPALFIDFPIIYLYDEWFPSGIGLIYYIGIIMYIKNYKRTNNKFILSIFILGIISIILASFKPIWECNLFYKMFSIIQFPWRFYMFGTLFLIITLCYIIKYIKKTTVIKTLITYTVIIFITNSFLYLNNVYTNKINDDEIMMGEYLPLNFNKNIIYNYKNKDIEYKKIDNKLKVSTINKKTTIELPLIYYKGYKACNEKKCYDVFKTDNGLVGVYTNNEIATFDAYYSGTTIYRICKYISILGLILFITYMYKVSDKYAK